MARISPSEAAAKFNRTMIGGSGSTLPKEVVQRAQANAAAALANMVKQIRSGQYVLQFHFVLLIGCDDHSCGHHQVEI